MKLQGGGIGGGSDDDPDRTPIELEMDMRAPVEGNLIFNQTGSLLVVGDSTGDVSVCDVVKAQRTSVLRSHVTPARAVFTEGEKGLNIFQSNNVFRSWDFGEGKISGPLESKPADEHPQKFMEKEEDGTYTLTHAGSGRIALQVKGVINCRRSRDGSKVRCTRKTAPADVYRVEVWDVAKRNIIFTRTCDSVDTGLSPDGRKLYLMRAVGKEYQIEVWDIVSGELKLRSPSIKSYWGASPTFSPDGTRISFGSVTGEAPVGKNWLMYRYTFHVWSTTDATRVLTVENVFSHYFNEDWSTLVLVSREGLAKWDFKNGAKRGVKFSAANNVLDILGVHNSRHSPKGNCWVFIATNANPSGTAILWNAETNRLHTLGAHSAMITWAEFSRDERYLLTSSNDGTVRLWDTHDGRLAVTLTLLNESDWLVTTPAGFFDGTPNAWKQLLWRFNQNNLDDGPVELYFNDFFHPNLLQDVLAGAAPRPKEGRELEKIDRRRPKVEIVAIGEGAAGALGEGRRVTVTVDVTDNAGRKEQPAHGKTSGAQDLRLLRNGSLVRVWHGDLFIPERGEGCERPSPNEPYRVRCRAEVPIVAGDNEFTAYAFNRDDVKSDDAVMSVKGAAALKRDGVLYVLGVGVNRYADAEYDLNYAVPDVMELAAAIEEQQARLGRSTKLRQYARVERITLTDERATKANILLALRLFAGGAEVEVPDDAPEALKVQLAKIRPAQPEDALLIYFAGHGTSRLERFYLLPHDYKGGGEKMLEEHGVSDVELNAALEKVDAGRLLMVLDTCRSGQVLGKENEGRAPMNSKGLAQLAYDKGMYILTAAQSRQAALEGLRLPDKRNRVAQIRHGLLTYTLLEAFNDASANSDGDDKLTEREWLDYAAGRVPQLQHEALRLGGPSRRWARRRAEWAFISKVGAGNGTESRSLQSPRVFYRRDTTSEPLVLATPRTR
jgi:WD40 repeat protein/uncharacterized caspase-like protein